MKKILVVFLVLAVAGGVFAQEGSWSVNGKVEIGTYIDFDNVKDSKEDPAVVHSSGYWSPYNYYGMRNGLFGINYSLGGLGAGVELSALDGDRIMGDINYDGENFKFQVKSSLQQLIAGTPNVDRLWGSYELLNEMIHLEIAYNSRDTGDVGIWESDTTGAWYSSGNFTYPTLTDYLNVWIKDKSFTYNDHGNYLMADIRLENLSFGVLLPKIFFDDTYTHGNAKYDYFDKDINAEKRSWANSAVFPEAVDGKDGGVLLVDDILKKMIFGVKFQMQPIEFAAQILMDDYAVYFGGRVFFGALTVGASFMGILAPTDGAGNSTDETLMRVGASLDYSADAFGAGVRGWLGVEGDSSAGHSNQIGVEPYFFYNVIPTHLQFRADVGFYFDNFYNGSEKDTDKSDIKWGIQPQLFWNFLGTGAGSYYSFNTGMIVRYRMVKETTNALDVSFRFSF